ncbi:hypothetical protein ACH5RR_006714 [Cinchona calisaya]|uniref:Uncharacterized protein n=1 Tax=Cinchona calisaya TaxID=153742 RepID=A0ABD3AQ34_9GENT
MVKQKFCLVHDFHNRFLENQIESPTAGLSVNEDSDINFTFRELHVGGDVILDGSEDEEFHDSEYDFHDDNYDDVIYEKFTDVDMDEKGEIVLNYGACLKTQSGVNIGSTISHDNRGAVGLNAELDTNLHIYDGKNITIFTELDSIESEGLLSPSSSSDEEGNKWNRPKFKKFREVEMQDLTFCVEMVFESKGQLKSVIESFGVK